MWFRFQSCPIDGARYNSEIDQYGSGNVKPSSTRPVTKRIPPQLSSSIRRDRDCLDMYASPAPEKTIRTPKVPNIYNRFPKGVRYRQLVWSQNHHGQTLYLWGTSCNRQS
jgi:hypothetical protein